MDEYFPPFRVMQMSLFGGITALHAKSVYSVINEFGYRDRMFGVCNWHLTIGLKLTQYQFNNFQYSLDFYNLGKSEGYVAIWQESG